MAVPVRLVGMLVLFAPLALSADALADLRAALAQLPATTPVHGTFEITSTSTDSDEGQPFQGRASVGFDVSDAGLRIVYPKPALVQANQESRAEALDPDRQTPVRSGLGRVRALQLSELLDSAAALSIELQNAQLLDTKAGNYHGRPARSVILKFSPKVSKGASKHVKKIDGTLTVWLGDDGFPIAVEQAVSVKASFLLISFEQVQKDVWMFTRVGDRLVATHHEETQKSDGFGQHNSSRVEESVRLEP